MKRITTHHDGHGRMERLLVLATDEPATEPPGNSSHHRYEFRVCSAEQLRTPDPVVGPNGINVGFLQFQRGPFDTEGSTPGTLGAAVIAALIDHYQGFLAGPLASRETALAVTKLQEAMFWLRARADARAAAGTLGTMNK